MIATASPLRVRMRRIAHAQFGVYIDVSGQTVEALRDDDAAEDADRGARATPDRTCGTSKWGRSEQVSASRASVGTSIDQKGAKPTAIDRSRDRFMPAPRVIAITSLAIIAAIYLLVSFHELSTFPPVHDDEPWIAAAPYKLAAEGVFGSDLFSGYHGAEEHLFQMPVYSFLMAAVFQIAGVGIFQMRLLSVLFGLGLIFLTYLMGKQAGGRKLGLLAALVLLSLRLTAEGMGTGIPLLDIARVGRYDIAVPFFGMCALLVFNFSEERASSPGYFGCGILTGLAGLSQGYGIFWLPALLAVVALRKGHKILKTPSAYLILSGCALVLAPAIAYAATEWADFRGQLAHVQNRFDVLNPAFYLDNLIAERYRYGALFPPSIAQVGIWIAALGIPFGLGVIVRDYKKGRSGSSLAAAVAVVAFAVLFAVLVKNKNFSYLIAVWPLLCVILARGFLALWDHYEIRRIRLILALALGAMLIEGATRIHHLDVAARQTTSYDDYTARIAKEIPLEARVLGLNTYWLGLRDFDYRSWLLPFFLSEHESVSFRDALARVNPDVILLDKNMIEYFEQVADPSSSRHATYVDFQSYLEDRGAVLTASHRDSTYGVVNVYRLNGGDRVSYSRENP